MRRDVKWHPRLIAMGAGAGAFILFQLMALFPTLSEVIYGRTIGPLFVSLLSSLTSVVPISLAEIVIFAFLARQLYGAIKGAAEVRNGDRRLSNALGAGMLRLGADVGVVVALFYILWGFHYARPPLEQRQQWNGRAADVEEVARLAEEMVEAANFAYSSMWFADDRGQPTDMVIEQEELLEHLGAGWEATEDTFGPLRSAVLGFGPPKPLMASKVLDYGLASGFYFPWTGEANFNRGTPPVSLPHVVAHEMSHQRGFAREDEANFAGYLAAAQASHPFARYSAYVFAQRQLLSALSRRDRDRAVGLARLRFPGVQRDIDAARDYWAQFEGPTSRAARSMNNAYLRTNRVPGGILSYGRSVELLIAYARSRGGWLLR